MQTIANTYTMFNATGLPKKVKIKNVKIIKGKKIVKVKEIFSSKLVSVDEGAFNLPDYH